jgi:hypothetical protein
LLLPPLYVLMMTDDSSDNGSPCYRASEWTVLVSELMVLPYSKMQKD